MSKSKKELKAEQIYNSILKNEIIPLIGDKSTFQDELEGVSKKLLGVKFKGVYASDRIPKLNDLSPYAILNLDKSDEPGSHWVSLVNIPNSKDSILYDSFGRNHKQIIPDLQFSGNGRILNDTKDIEQKITQEDCGARSIAFLVFFDRYGAKKSLLI